jgi:hypothetical protein
LRDAGNVGRLTEVKARLGVGDESVEWAAADESKTALARAGER